MSEEPTPKFQPAMRQNESQHQRWMKYGANVAIMSVVAIVLVGLLVYLAQKHSKRIDTTVAHAQSLSPQTENIGRDLKTKFKIVALYPRLKSEEDEPDQQDYYQPVVDLLNEYSAMSSNITTEVIDPNTEKDKLTKLVTDVTNQYGGEVKDYKAIIADLPGQIDVIKKFSNSELPILQALPLDQVQDQELYGELIFAQNAVHYSGDLDHLKSDIDTDLDQAIPSYKEAVDEIQGVFSGISTKLKFFQEVLGQARENPSLPKPYRDYIPDAIKRAGAIGKTVEGELDRLKRLGELKELNDFRDQLKNKSIIVMGEGHYKIIKSDQIWMQEPKNPFIVETDTHHRFRFAGERQISMAIAALSTPKPQMVVFVRPPGMQPLTGAMGREGPLSALAERLREYNFEVAEKSGGPSFDQQQQPPPMPEPTDEQMKSAIWVVVQVPTQSQMGMSMGSPVDGMLQQHLAEGGSAMVLAGPDPDPTGASGLPGSLGTLGVKMKTNMVLLHDAVKQNERRSTDAVATFARTQQIGFLLNRYGEHPLTAPLQDLDCLLLVASPVQAADSIPIGVTITPLLPVPASPHAWAASLARLQSNQSETISFDPTTDIENTAAKPLYMGAAIEKTGGGRVVAVGSFNFLTDEIINFPDDKDPDVQRLPGNAEFAMNCIFWLAHRDSMLAISPHTLQMARVEAMSTGKLNFFRVGVLTVGLPLLVIISGLVVYYRRWD